MSIKVKGINLSKNKAMEFDKRELYRCLDIEPIEVGLVMFYDSTEPQHLKKAWIEYLRTNKVLSGTVKYRYIHERDRVILESALKYVEVDNILERTEKYVSKVIEEGIVEVLKDKESTGGYIVGGGKIEELIEYSMFVESKEGGIEYLKKIKEVLGVFFRGNYAKFRVSYEYISKKKKSEEGKGSSLNRDIKKVLEYVSYEEYIKEFPAKSTKEIEGIEGKEWLRYSSIEQEKEEDRLLEELMQGLIIETYADLIDLGVIEIKKKKNWIEVIKDKINKK